MPRWLLRLCLAFMLLGVVLYAFPAHCAAQVEDVAVELARLREQVDGLAEKVDNLVKIYERKEERRPVFEADLVAVREQVMREMGGHVQRLEDVQKAHGARITDVEMSKIYAIGVLALAGLVFGFWAKNKRVSIDSDRPPPPTPAPEHAPAPARAARRRQSA